MRPATPLITVILLAALGALVYGVLGITEVGTCASGGPYVSARECPSGTGVTALILGGGAVVYTITSIVAAFRSFAAGGFWFGVLFVVLGATFLEAEISGHVNGGGGVGWFLGGLFIAMGIGPMVAGAIFLWRARHDDEPTRFVGPYVVGAELRKP